MEVHLVLKKNPSDGVCPAFSLSQNKPNSIEFSRTQTQFDFKSVLNSNADDVFQNICEPLIKTKLLNKQDALFFTLGPTNSGKSHIMFKPENTLVEKCLQSIFSKVGDDLISNLDCLKSCFEDIHGGNINSNQTAVNSESNTAITVSMFELHMSKVNDLLSTENKNFRNDLGIITDKIDRKLRPHHMTRHLVSDFEAAKSLLDLGASRRRISETKANIESSRSHCFIFIEIHYINGNHRETTRLTLADLAGLERARSAQTNGTPMFKETNYTNNSMTSLGLALESHAIKKFSMSSLRANKLTRLILTDHIRNQTALSIIVSLDPFGEEGLIHQTLKYINPIKYQDLKRKVKPILLDKKISKNTHEHMVQALSGSVQKWKHKYKNTKAQLTQNELEIRKQLYQDQEREIVRLELLHKEEKQRINDENIEKLNFKIEELAKIHQQEKSELKENLIFKEKELALTREESTVLKQELENIYREKLNLEKNLNDLENSNGSKIKELEILLIKANDKESALENEIKALKLVIDEVSNEKNLLINNNRSEILEEQLFQLEQEISLNKQQFFDLEKSKKELDNVLRTVKNSLDENIGKLKATKEKLHISSAKVKELTDIELKLNESLSSLQFSSDCKISELENQLNNFKNEKNEMIINHKEKLNYAKNESIKEIEKLNEKINVLNEEINSINKSKLSLDNNIQILQAEHATAIQSLKDEHEIQLEQNKSKYENNSNILENDFKRKEKDLKAANSEIESLKAEIHLHKTEFENSLNEKALEISNLNILITELEKNLQCLLNEKLNLKNEVERLKIFENKNEKMKEVFDCEPENLKEKFNDLKLKLEKLESDKVKDGEMAEILNLKTTKLQQYTSENKELKNLNVELESEISALKNKISQSENIISNIEIQKFDAETINQKLATVEDKLAASEKEKKDLEEKVLMWKSQKYEKKKQLSEVKKQLAKVISEKDAALTQLEENLKKTKSDKEILQSKFDDLDMKHLNESKILHSKIEELEEKLAKMTKENKKSSRKSLGSPNKSLIGPSDSLLDDMNDTPILPTAVLNSSPLKNLASTPKSKKNSPKKSKSKSLKKSMSDITNFQNLHVVEETLKKYGPKTPSPKKNPLGTVDVNSSSLLLQPENLSNKLMEKKRKSKSFEKGKKLRKIVDENAQALD